MKNIVIITDVDFYNEGAGHRMRIRDMISYLAPKCKLHIIYLGLVNMQVNDFCKSFNTQLFALDLNSQLDEPEYVNLVKKVFSINTFHSSIFQFIHLSYLLKWIPLNTVKILDAHDIIHERVRSFNNFNAANWGYILDQNIEIQIFECYDYVLFICETDHLNMVGHLSSGKSLYVPLSAKPIPTAINDNVTSIGFLGSEYTPNVDGLNYFIDSVWQYFPHKESVQFNVFGNVSTRLDHKKNLEGVKLNGYVNNLEEMYESIDIIINPVRFGSGLKIKSIEALSYGKPLITTPHGARGLNLESHPAFIIANNPEDFLLHISQLSQNKHMRQRLQYNALSFVRRKFSASEAYAPLSKVLL